MNYTLTATELKNGKTLYEIHDETGKTVAKRTSTRKYVACTVDGELFFGRRDLVGKGDHGKRLARLEDYRVNTPEKYAKIVADAIKEIRWSNRLHLQTYRRYTKDLNEPIKDWQKELLVKYHGQAVADAAKTQWDYQIASHNDEDDIRERMRYIGTYEEWVNAREECAAKLKLTTQVVYL